MRQPAARPVLALLTDFGTRDPYVGAMKGAALSVCADATLVDLTHEIAPHDVAEAARHLAAAAPYFPPETAFVVVVDPGVGSARRALAARAGGCWFVGPDNGVLTPVLTPRRRHRGDHRAPATCATSSAATFEGRDRFAPAAAWLLRGVPLEALGAAGRRSGSAGAAAAGRRRGRRCAACWWLRIASATWRRRSIAIAFEAFAGGGAVRLTLAGSRCGWSPPMPRLPTGKWRALFGSAGLLEVAARSAPALGRPGVQPGAVDEVRQA